MYKQTLYDDFNDNSISAAKWPYTYGSPIESSEKLNLKLQNSPNNGLGVRSPYTFDVSSKIVAFRMYTSGSSPVSMFPFIGIYDNSGYYLDIIGYSDETYVDFDTSEVYFTAIAQPENPLVGFGPDWVDGSWIGFTYDVDAETVYLLKSTDAQSWVNVWYGRLIFPDTLLDFENVSLYIRLVCNSTYVANTYLLSVDDVSVFEKIQIPVRVGGAFVSSVPKVRVGGAFVEASPKVRVGGSWVVP